MDGHSNGSWSTRNICRKTLEQIDRGDNIEIITH